MSYFPPPAYNDQDNNRFWQRVDDRLERRLNQRLENFGSTWAQRQMNRYNINTRVDNRLNEVLPTHVRDQVKLHLPDELDRQLGVRWTGLLYNNSRVQELERKAITQVESDIDKYVRDSMYNKEDIIGQTARNAFAEKGNNLVNRYESLLESKENEISDLRNGLWWESLKNNCVIGGFVALGSWYAYNNWSR